jgi:hypothetical protein
MKAAFIEVDRLRDIRRRMKDMKLITVEYDYFEDPDDSLIDRYFLSQFVECEKFMPIEELTHFNLEYFFERPGTKATRDRNIVKVNLKFMKEYYPPFDDKKII